MKKIIKMLILFTLGVIVLLGANHLFAEEKNLTGLFVQGETDPVENKVVFTIPYGSKFTKENIALTATYIDGEGNSSTEVVTPESLETISPEPSLGVNTYRVGKHNVKANYGGMYATFVLSVVPRKVTGVKLVTGDTKSATIFWNSLEEAGGYEIYESDTANGTYNFLESTIDQTNSYVFKNMTQGQRKYLKVRVKGQESSDLAGELSESVLIGPKPEKVDPLIWGKSYKTKAQVSWKKVEGADGYLVYYKKRTSSSYKLAVTVKDTQALVTGLTSGNDYDIRVRAYALRTDYNGEYSSKLSVGTNPSSPGIPIYVGGDARLKMTWSSVTGASQYRVYLSTSRTGGFTKVATRSSSQSKSILKTGLHNNRRYYIKVQSVRYLQERELASDSAVKSIYVKAVPATSTGAKLFSNFKKFKKSSAYKKYTTFRKNVVYGKSYIVPGMKTTDVSGFQSNRMTPQSICAAGKYLLISAYDYNKVNESVIYIMNKSTRKYISSMVLPHKGHVGGIAYDGSNLWIAYGDTLQSIKYSTICSAANKAKKYTNVTSFSTRATTAGQASYVTYYRGRIWAGSYSQNRSAYLYGYSIQNKTGKANLKATCKILLPNRTQGVAMTSKGYLLVSRSCQTKKGKSGFLSKMETYKPSWGKYKGTIHAGKVKKTVSMPPMNEGIVVDGKYTLVIYESVAFSECQARLDRITAFKTSLFDPSKKKK